MNTKQDDGCYTFSTDVNGKPEKGTYCVCSTPLCNEGTIKDQKQGDFVKTALPDFEKFYNCKIDT